jgi:hypothetical protein
MSEAMQLNILADMVSPLPAVAILPAAFSVPHSGTLFLAMKLIIDSPLIATGRSGVTIILGVSGPREFSPNIQLLTGYPCTGFSVFYSVPSD